MLWYALFDELLLQFDLSLLQHQVFACHSFPNILNVFYDRLEMRSCVIGASDENVVVLARCCRHIQRRDGHESGQKII